MYYFLSQFVQAVWSLFHKPSTHSKLIVCLHSRRDLWRHHRFVHIHLLVAEVVVVNVDVTVGVELSLQLRRPDLSS